MSVYGLLHGEDDELAARLTAPLSLVSRVPVDAHDSLALRRSARAEAAQRWELETGLEPLSASGQAAFNEFVRRGLSDEYRVLLPQSVGVVLRRTHSPGKVLLSGAGAAGSWTLALASNDGLMPRGTMFRLGNGTKVYTTLEDLSGPGSVRVFPQLRTDADATYLYRWDDVVMVCHADVDTVQGMHFADGILMSVDRIRFVESVPRDVSELLPEVVTSTPYTVAVDTNGVRTDLPELLAVLWSLEELSVTNTSRLVGGVLTATIVYLDYDHVVPEDIRNTSELTGGTLTVVIVYKDYDHEPPEEITNTSNLIGGVLTVTIVYVDYDHAIPDDITNTSNLEGGSLT